MRFFQTLFAAAAFVAAAAAKPEIHNFPSKVVPGKTYEITYIPADDTPTTFILRRGDPNHLDNVATLTTTATKGKFSWTVSKDFPNGDDYALEIIQGAPTNNNYISPISLSGSTASDVVSSSSTAAPTSTGASSSKATISTTGSASVTTGASNSTVTTGSLTRSTTGSAPTTATTTGGSGPPQSTGAAATLGSPLALVLGGFAAMAYFH